MKAAQSSVQRFCTHSNFTLQATGCYSLLDAYWAAKVHIIALHFWITSAPKCALTGWDRAQLHHAELSVKKIFQDIYTPHPPHVAMPHYTQKVWPKLIGQFPVTGDHREPWGNGFSRRPLWKHHRRNSKWLHPPSSNWFHLLLLYIIAQRSFFNLSYIGASRKVQVWDGGAPLSGQIIGNSFVGCDRARNHEYPAEIRTFGTYA